LKNAKPGSLSLPRREHLISLIESWLLADHIVNAITVYVSDA
jgi:hypothetical protein